MITLAERGLTVDWLASGVAALFRSSFLNADGLMSRQNPPTERTLLDNLDDVAPFLLYFGHADFLLDQVNRLSPQSFEQRLAQGNILQAYKIDEYLGGLNAIYTGTGSSHAQALLANAVEKSLRYFYVPPDHFSETYDLVTGERSPYFSPWSAGLLETYLELDLPDCDLEAKVESILQCWVSHPFFVRYGLFPFRGTYEVGLQACEGRMATRGRWCGEPPVRGAEKWWRNAIAVLPPVYWLRRWWHRRRHSGHWAQVMKSNTTPVFALLALFAKSALPFCKEAVLHWIASLATRLVGKDGEVYAAWYEDGTKAVPNLVASFIAIDVLCEAYRTLDGPSDWLVLAEQIARYQLGKAWPNGLIPMMDRSAWDHLDGQIDFAIALRRLAELAKLDGLREQAFSIAENALALHWTGEGFCTHLDREGSVARLQTNTVDPKYNGLALKGLIHLKERNVLIYDSQILRDLFKDR